VDVLNIANNSDRKAGKAPKVNDGLHQSRIDRFVRPLAHTKKNRMIKQKDSKENMEITHFFKPAKGKPSVTVGKPPTAASATLPSSHKVSQAREVTKMYSHRDATRTAKAIADSLLRRGAVFERDVQNTGTSPSLRIGQLA